MDVKLIRDKQLLERWVAGKLAPPEARYFEDLVRKQPSLADELALPDTLKKLMRLLDDTGLEWQEQSPKFWHNALVPVGLAAVAVLAIGAALFLGLGKSRLGTQYNEFKSDALQGLLNEPIATRTTAVHLTKPGEPGLATYAIGSRKAPTFAELRPDVRLMSGHLYSAKIQRDDGTFWGRFDNLLRDSNGELRIALNSGAFAAGNYTLEVRQINLRGDGEVVGVARLSVTPGN
jgi:hypothetical protein